MTKTVVIIGGGVAGLAAGGFLSRKGFRVKLFEANAKLGGCCANTILNGYVFNDGALYLAFPGILDHVFEKLELDRPTLLPMRKITANLTTTLPDGTQVNIGDGLDLSIENCSRKIDKAKIQKELETFMARWKPVLRLFADDILIRPFSLLHLLARGWKHLSKFKGTIASEMYHSFSDEAVRATLAGVLLYAGVPPQKAPASLILGLVAMISEGFHLPEGGMGRISEVLSNAFKKNGGEIFLNSPVKKICIANGRVSGVEVDSHGFARADAVISTASGMLTYGSLLDQKIVPAELKRKVETAPLSHRALSLQLGLSNKIDVRSHSNKVIPMMEEQYRAFTPEENDMRCVIYSVPTVTMPELAPQGCSIIEMFPPIRQDLPFEQWDEEKEKVADIAIRALQRIHKIEIAVRRVRSPKDFENQMHLYKGAIYGLSPAANPKAQFPHNPPIPGLFHAGQSTFPGFGAGIAAMSGILAAEELMKK